jgi:hypothetical protein
VPATGWRDASCACSRRMSMSFTRPASPIR